MLRLNNGLSNAHKRRTLRPLLANTQATPKPMTLSTAFVRTGGALTGTATTGISGNTMGAIIPGLVASKMVGRVVTPAYSGGPHGDTETAAGLFAQFVGGDLDDLHEADEVAVWSGRGAWFEILSPAFDDVTNTLATLAADEDGTDEKEVWMKPNAKAQLAGAVASPGQAFGQVARLVERHSANAVVVELLV